ncbi:hypothetical protein [Lysobacter gummosus]
MDSRSAIAAIVEPRRACRNTRAAAQAIASACTTTAAHFQSLARSR